MRRLFVALLLVLLPSAAMADRTISGPITFSNAFGGSGSRVATGPCTSVFETYGALGNGTANDTAAIQAALNAGGRACGIAGKTYSITTTEVSALNIPSNTTMDCGGATIKVADSTANVIGVVQVGTFGSPVGTELGASNVEIANCHFLSNISFLATAIFFQPGSSNIRIHHNDFRSTSNFALQAVLNNVAHIDSVEIADNTGDGVRNFVLWTGDEKQTFHHLAVIPNGSTTYTVTEPILSDIAGGEAYGVVVAYDDAPQSYRLYGPFDGGADFTYAAPTITFATPLPAGVGDPVVSLFTWRSEAKPATDSTNITISRNTITNIRGRGVAHYCVVHVVNDHTPGFVCTNNLQVNDNIFTGPYQLEGMIQANPLGSGAHVNSFMWSQDLTQSNWIKSQTTIVPGFYAPDGTQTAQFVREDTSNTTHSVRQSETVQGGHTSTLFCIVSAPGVNGRYRLQLKNVTDPGDADGGKIEVDLRAVTATPSNVGTGTNAAGGILPYGYDQKTTSTWYKIWVSATLPGTNARGTLFLEDNSGNPTYAGDGASGVYVWGCQYEEDAAVPFVYMPSKSTPSVSVGSQLISINGANNWTVNGNTLGPAAAQGIHVEDWGTNGTITGNVVHDTGAVGIYLTDARSVVVANNIVRNPPTTCFSLDYADPSPPALGADGPYGTTDYMTLTGNICDAQSNPAMTAAYRIGAAGNDFHLEWNNNVARDLIASADFIDWENDAQTRLNTQEFPIPIAPGKLGTCTAGKEGQRRFAGTAMMVCTSGAWAPVSTNSASAWMVPDGTDQRANLVAALAASAGRVLRFPKGTFVLDYTTDSPVALPANTTLECDGPASVLSVKNVTGTRAIFNVLASGVTVRNCGVAITNAVAASTSILFSLGGGASNFTIDGMTYDGAVAPSGGGINHVSDVILPLGTAGNAFTGIFVRNSSFANLARLYLRTSVAGQTAALKEIRFTGNTVTSSYRAPISLNSPFGETSDVEVSGNRFVDNFGKTTGGTDNYMIGVGSGKRVRVIGNDLSGAGDGIHVEESAEDQVLSNNTMALTDTDAESFYVSDNNIGTGSFVAPINIAIIGNIAKGPGSGSATKFGVRLVNDASGTPPVKGVTIAENTFTGFARGISATSEDEVSTITGNTLRSNAIGLWSVKPLLQARGNLFDSNTEDLHSSVGGMWGTNDFLAIPTMSADTGKVSVDGFRLTLGSVTLGASTTTLVDMAPLGVMAAGRVSAHYRQATAVYQMANLDFDYDGTTLTTLSGRVGGDGAAILDGLVLDSGKLALSFTNSGGALTGGRVQVNFSGMLGAN